MDFTKIYCEKIDKVVVEHSGETEWQKLFGIQQFHDLDHIEEHVRTLYPRIKVTVYRSIAWQGNVSDYIRLWWAPWHGLGEPRCTFLSKATTLIKFDGRFSCCRLGVL